MNRLFEIQTLSANQVPKRYNPNTHYLPHGYQMKKRKRSLADYGRLADPVTIITGGLAVISQLFPNLFGAPAIPMTDADWVKMFPGNGYWTSLYRNYIKTKIPNTRDLWRLERFTGYFVWDNRGTIAPEVPESCYPYDEPHRCPAAMAKFFNLLKKESQSSGNYPVGQFPGGIGTLDPSSLLLIGGGVVLLMLLMKNKKRQKR